MTSEQPTSFTLRLDVTVDLSRYWEIEMRDGQPVALGINRIFDRASVGEMAGVPFTAAEALHGIREELMGTVNGWPFAVTAIEEVTDAA